MRVSSVNFLYVFSAAWDVIQAANVYKSSQNSGVASNRPEKLLAKNTTEHYS